MWDSWLSSGIRNNNNNNGILPSPPGASNNPSSDQLRQASAEDPGRSEVLYMGGYLNFMSLGSFEKWISGAFDNLEVSGVEGRGKICQA